MPPGFVIIADRGGHLHNALMLLEQMQYCPQALVTTYGPDIDPLKNSPPLHGIKVISIPHLFIWFGKIRILNPANVLIQWFRSLILAWRLRPENVLSFGGTNCVFFCYWAKLFGARIIHIECMNQVLHPSVTGRTLYPICSELYVQWPELIKMYGPKARYEGWVL